MPHYASFSLWAVSALRHNRKGTGTLLADSPATERCVLRNAPLQQFLSSEGSCCPVVISLNSGVEGQGSWQDAEEGKFGSEKRDWWERW